MLTHISDKGLCLVQVAENAIGGKTVKPLNIQDLDLSKPEDRKTYAEYRKKRDSGAIEINLTK